MSLETVIQGHKQTLGNRYTCQLEILTPVHVGSGVKLAKGLDFWSDERKTYIVSQEALMDYLTKTNEHDLFDSELERQKILKKVVATKTYNLPCSGGEIFEFERDGNNTPYLPGSSIKGAIRTALFEDIMQNVSSDEYNNAIQKVFDNKRAKKETAANDILKEVFGKDPNHNLMRALTVSDVGFKEKDIDLKKVLILNLNRNDWGWKRLGGRNEWRAENASPLFVEMIKPDEVQTFTLKLDSFLFENERAKEKLKIKHPLSISSLLDSLNNHADSSLRKELEFLDERAKEDRSRQLQKLIEYVEDLRAMIPKQETAEAKTTCLLRLGWGSGWRSMTGDWLEAVDLDDLRWQFNMGKFFKNQDGEREMFSEFPKTRKIVFSGNTPQYLSGWVKITVNS